MKQLQHRCRLQMSVWFLVVLWHDCDRGLLHLKYFKQSKVHKYIKSNSYILEQYQTTNFIMFTTLQFNSGSIVIPQFNRNISSMKFGF